ncbi:MAG: DUF3098 domain-containing protein, partial [Bacteroidota bacterium]
VVKNKKKANAAASKVAPTTSRRSRTAPKTVKNEKLLFEKKNFTLILIGLGLVALGLIMMLGGSQPNPDEWKDEIIYAPRIMIFGPILILSGLIVEVYAIFKK